MVIDNLCFHFLLDTGHSLAREIRSYISIEFWDRLLMIIVPSLLECQIYYIVIGNSPHPWGLSS